MKAMILSAGFGTRLRPITNNIPKPLVPVKGKAMIDWVLESLERAGVSEAIVNTHYLPEKIEEHLAGYKGPIALTLRHETEILGTGGGLYNCRDFLAGEDFLLCNADILCTADLSKLVEAHRSSGALATLMVNRIESRGMLLVDENQKLVGRVKHHTGERRIVDDPQGVVSERGFAAFHVIGKDFFSRLHHVQSDIIQQYLELIDRGEPIAIHEMEECYWNDVGSLESLERAEREFPGL